MFKQLITLKWKTIALSQRADSQFVYIGVLQASPPLIESTASSIIDNGCQDTLVQDMLTKTKGSFAGVM